VNESKYCKEAANEATKIASCDHPGILRVHKVYEAPEMPEGVCALQMELMRGGDLKQHLEAARTWFGARMPQAAVLRFTRLLLHALAYLHDEKQMLHGDIKPANILMTCKPPADHAAAFDQYASAFIKLADFGLAKSLADQDQEASFALTNMSTHTGVIKGTMWYLSPEVLHGSAKGRKRCCDDDVWSACLVILEMDTGLELSKLMKSPGSVSSEQLQLFASPLLLPLLWYGLFGDERFRCSRASQLLQILDKTENAIFEWQVYVPAQPQPVTPADMLAGSFEPMHSAAALQLESALLEEKRGASLSLPPPLDLNFDISDVLSAATSLGRQTESSTGQIRPIRRRLKSSVYLNGLSIPIWQELINWQWRQCTPSKSRNLEVEHDSSPDMIDFTRYRSLSLHPSAICKSQNPFAFKIEPYCASASQSDVAIMQARIHESLPEWDIADMVQVVNEKLGASYANYRHQVAVCCNGHPNEHLLFHVCPEKIIDKIWQDGEGHDPRLSVWAEVGKGAYFSEHLMYGYAYTYKLWPSPPSYTAEPEPPIGSVMRVFASLVTLGNVADMGPGCETCPSPAWDAWKKESERQPKPTRPPAMELPVDAAHRRHVLDLSRIKETPRYDSVKSTEGDLSTAAASVNMSPSGTRISALMHPRLLEQPQEWGQQYVVFDRAASYPLFIITLTKTRKSPVGALQLKQMGISAMRVRSLGFNPQEMKEAGFEDLGIGCAGFSKDELASIGLDAAALKVAGCTASKLKTAGFTAENLKSSGFSAADLRSSGFDPFAIGCAGYSKAEITATGLEASHLKDAGCDLEQIKALGYDARDLRQGGWTALELRRVGFDLVELINAGFSSKSLKHANFDARSLRASGFTARSLLDADFSSSELQCSGFSCAELRDAGVSGRLLKEAGFGLNDFQNCGFSPVGLRQAGFSIDDLRGAGYECPALKDAGFGPRLLMEAGFNVQSLKSAGFDAFSLLKSCHCDASALRIGGFSAEELLGAGFTLESLYSGGYDCKSLRSAGFDASALRAAGESLAALASGGYGVDELAALGVSAEELEAAGFERQKSKLAANMFTAQKKAAAARYLADKVDIWRACSNGDETVVIAHLDNDVVVSSKDGDGSAPLHFAAGSGHVHIVQLLLSRNASVQVANAAQLTPLHCAAIGGHRDAAQLLLTNGADCNAKDVYARTALDVAVKNNRHEFAHWLRTLEIE